MYEIGMSSDARKEPVFDIQERETDEFLSEINTGTVSASGLGDPIYFEEDTPIDAGSILMRSGIVIAFALAVFGGYKFHQGSSIDSQIAGNSRTDWAGRPLATNEQGNLVWPKENNGNARQIDLTKTASIRSGSKPKIIEAKPRPVGNKLSSGNGVHIVKSGDTLSGIAKRYNMKTAELIALNKIDNPRAIKPGMKLILLK